MHIVKSFHFHCPIMYLAATLAVSFQDTVTRMQSNWNFFCDFSLKTN